MKHLEDFLNEELYDEFNHKLEIGMIVGFKDKDIRPYGQIQEFDEETGKATIKTIGWSGDPNNKPKLTYKINLKTRKCYQMNISDDAYNKLKEQGILI